MNPRSIVLAMEVISAIVITGMQIRVLAVPCLFLDNRAQSEDEINDNNRSMPKSGRARSRLSIEL